MIPRGKLYISYKDLYAGIYYCLTNRFKSQKSFVDKQSNKLVCLSVRTGLDLVLSALNLPAGSEVLVTDINIPDMFTIIAGHDLKCVPLSIDRRNLNISATQMEAAITPVTRAILITHLFGGIMEMENIVAVAKKHNLIILEDCAQAYAGNVYEGNSSSDVIMFSFGFIKTNTAVSGAVIKINDPKLHTEVARLNDKYDRHKTAIYLKRLFKAVFVKLLTNKTIYTAFYNFVTMMGKDFEEVQSNFTRGFPGEDIFSKIRYRPCVPNEKLLQRKLIKFDHDIINKRMQLAADILTDIPDDHKIGSLNMKNTYWVMPVQTRDPQGLISYLRNHGFDASQKASSLIRLKTMNVSECLTLENLVYLPVYPAMSKKHRNKLTQLLINFPN